MYERILVALDGSELAERVLPHVEALGQAFGSTLVLLRATTSPETVTSTLDTGATYRLDSGPMLPTASTVDPMPIIDTEREAMDDYLTTIAERLEEHGLRVQIKQPMGPASDAILRLADQIDADLIAMTTHRPDRHGATRLRQRRRRGAAPVDPSAAPGSHQYGTRTRVN